MSEESIQEKFVKVCGLILESLSGMISDAKDAGLTTMVPTQLDFAHGMLGKVNPVDLVIAFIEQRKYWPDIFKKNIGFLEKGVPEVFSNSPISPEVLVEPIKIYNHLVANGFKGSKNPKKYPINGEDIEGLWMRFELLIKASCRYNLENGNKYDLDEYNQRFGLM
jgi:hypothetical protein